jgi:DNA-binding ferritin-like protein
MQNNVELQRMLSDMRKNPELQQMLEEVQKEKKKLTDQLREYQVLKQEIISLRDKAPTDPEAMKKLEAINLDVQQNGAKKHKMLMQKIGETKTKLEKIAERLKQMFPEGVAQLGEQVAANAVATKKAVAPKKVGRRFA